MTARTLQLERRGTLDQNNQEMEGDFRLMARTAGCGIAGFRKDAHILTLQAHPEFHNDFMNALLDKMAGGSETSLLKAARASLSQGTDGAAFARWAQAFYAGGGRP